MAFQSDRNPWKDTYINDYLLTECEVCTEKYLPEVIVYIYYTAELAARYPVCTQTDAR